MKNELIFNCSELGRVMANGRAKGSIGKDAMTMLWEKKVMEKYGRRKLFFSKFTRKGNLMEEKNIVNYFEFRLIKNPDAIPLVKNEEKFDNGWVKGYPDLLDKLPPNASEVVDIKSSWDLWTFLQSELTPAYKWQGIGYCWLTGARTFKLTYVLESAPLTLIDDEVRRNSYQLDDPDDPDQYADMVEKVQRNMTFDDIPLKDRVREFVYDVTDDDIEQLKERITELRSLYQGIEL